MNLPPEQPAKPPSLNGRKLTVGWIVILGLLTLVFGSWERERENPNRTPNILQDSSSVREVALQRNRQGHYVANGFINGQEVTFLLDTGATHVAIPEALGEKLGLRKMARSYANTANGVVEVYNTRINHLRLGNIELQDIPASLNPGLNHGSQILLGMSVLKNIEFTQRGNTLTLKQFPEG